MDTMWYALEVREPFGREPAFNVNADWWIQHVDLSPALFFHAFKDHLRNIPNDSDRALFRFSSDSRKFLTNRLNGVFEDMGNTFGNTFGDTLVVCDNSNNLDPEIERGNIIAEVMFKRAHLRYFRVIMARFEPIIKG